MLKIKNVPLRSNVSQLNRSTNLKIKPHRHTNQHHFLNTSTYISPPKRGTTTVVKHCRHLHGPPLPRSSWTATAAMYYRGHD
nr:hypothetical protein [Tanacetum cinerariifolium]